MTRSDTHLLIKTFADVWHTEESEGGSWKTNLEASAVCSQEVMVGAGEFGRSRWIEGIF